MKPSKPAEQLPLEFQHVPSSGRDDLLVSDPLSAAISVVDSWPNWPSPVVILAGPIGSGKTHLLCALGQELVRGGRKVLFATCGLLVQELLIAKRDLKLSRVLKRLEGYEVLIVDDLGYVQQSREVDPKRREVLLHQIQRLAHERVMHAPLWELGFLNAVGPHVEESGLGLIAYHPYSAPYEDLRVKR